MVEVTTSYRTTLGLALVLSLSLLATARTQDLISIENIVVKRVVDWDTIELATGAKIQYAGIKLFWNENTGGKTGKMQKNASVAYKKLIEGQCIRLDIDIELFEQHNASLAFIYADSIFVNKWLVEQGFARVADYPIDIEHHYQLLEAEDTAKAARRGFWSIEVSTGGG